MCTSVLSIYVNAPHVCRAHGGPKRASDSLALLFQWCEPRCGHQVLLEEQQMLLTTKPTS